ncbi:MAG: chemotaxis protein CheA [Betaproteobacteria bacterium HGW-Betaproteobacteria-1]|jgi:two-component system chemotaxis sensor kinase CheA|nr:MAG: chemotaxis protein CheA [Betaproteobacteria bacterium HGW-Betaproteobacteria-1]
MTVDMSQFYEVFFDEAEELLAEAERLLLAIDVANPDNEDLNAIFRAAHSIKGGAATFGFMDMTEITHVLENLLDRIRKHEMALTVEHVDAFLAAKDVLEMELDGHRHGSDVDQEQVAAVKTRLASLTQAEAAADSAPAADTTPAVTPAAPVEASQVSAHVAPAAALPPPADGLTQFNILLPELKEKDIANLQEELGLLGEVAGSKHESGRTLLTLNTDSSESDIVSICSFILNPDDLVITQATADAGPSTAVTAEHAAEHAAEAGDTETASSVKVHEEAGYGLFAEEGKEAVEEGYGFFAPFTPHADAPSSLKIDDNTAAMSQEEIARAVASPVETAAVNKATAVTEKRNPAKPDAGHASAETTSIRVGVEKVDQLINLVGELVITQAMIEQRINALDPIHHEALINSVGQLTRNTRDLQEAVMSIRMMPMDFVFSRFPRMVRDLAGKLGKKVELVTVGAATELDKGLIERIVDPLTHLVRNSVDHGVETPDKRKAANKPEAGKLTLSAAHKGGSIVIEVTDDGAGLNRDKLLAKAKSNGLNVSENMSDNDVYQLIFAPGFSTAEVVTDVSGRGVGMDVVKRNIAAMNGSIEIRSALGYGTTIAISLPLTLAILDGMSVSLGSSVYVIPLNLIVETLQPRAEDMKTVTGEGRMVHVRGEYLPVIALHALFGQETEVSDPTDGVLVLIEAEGKKAALFVDALVGQQQVVIKSLETNFRKIQGVSGATIMGDGSVALILDVPALIQMGQTHNYLTGATSFASKAVQTISKEYTQ